MNPSRVINVRPSHNIKTVVYIMHNAFRIRNNHALYHALSFEKELHIVLVPPRDTHIRTIDFFNKSIGGYETVFEKYASTVTKLNIEELSNIFFKEGTHIVMDMHYLKEEKELYENVLGYCIYNNLSFDLVETNTLVPVTETSNKEEYSAKTIRSKIHRRIQEFLDPVLLENTLLPIEKKTDEILEDFILNKLPFYDLRNDPSLDYGSGLSPYLKYGFISPLTIYKKLENVEIENKDLFIEELIIRRELAYNFVYFNKEYYLFDSITYGWAYNTMKNHLLDQREYLYTLDDYINFNTHDTYFNTAMKEMVILGTMHGYMRMYWCKKIIEWSSTYKEAYETAIYLNNHYFIDGNTPNGFTGVAWCFGKHDRAWKERNIFGKLRYMNKQGLDKKFNMNGYVERIESKVREYGI